jgi:hypothetical protein
LNEMFAPGALVVEPDEHQVRNALKHLLGASVAGADLRAKGLERAKFFSWEHAAARTLAVLEGAVS